MTFNKMFGLFCIKSSLYTDGDIEIKKKNRERKKKENVI